MAGARSITQRSGCVGRFIHAQTDVVTSPNWINKFKIEEADVLQRVAVMSQSHVTHIKFSASPAPVLLCTTGCLAFFVATESVDKGCSETDTIHLQWLAVLWCRVTQSPVGIKLIMSG